MSEYSGFILVNRHTLGPYIFVGCRKTWVSDCTSSTVVEICWSSLLTFIVACFLLRCSRLVHSLVSSEGRQQNRLPNCIVSSRRTWSNKPIRQGILIDLVFVHQFVNYIQCGELEVKTTSRIQSKTKITTPLTQ